ncbi:hypothetical protein BDF20DRAFT_870226 [Mycotypha africana]|uniref:uncharacterized protein n=1 Tax=Mycotypha africana TaxID=64632 RepID=UPI00230021AD|nr:uncharacterized protein BDF20DRAFT_870226 [Mycotypha africana]KAI8979540.1 hypothetical protein BDF20DRAFT_870226 [Mycotypha africana]
MISLMLVRFQVDTFDTVKEWVPFIEQARPEIRVCIGTTSEIPLSGKQYAEIIDWCTAHQFDFVDMDEKSDIPMDKVGVDLVVDILQTNFWEGRKDRDGESAEGVDGIDISGLAGVLGSLSMASEQTDTTSDDALGELNEDNNDFEMPSSKDIDDMRKKLWTSMEEEDGLEKTFKLMQAMREQGKQMTDDERRKMAATVALAFSSQLSME